MMVLVQTFSEKFFKISTMKKILLALLILYTGMAYAQQRTVQGTVTAIPGNEPLPGVNIQVKGTSTGTATAQDGTYSITVSSNQAVLVFSFLGFTTQEVEVGPRSVIDIQLEENIRALGEVVVIGYGTQVRSEVTGAISSIKSEEITQTPVLRVEQALQGRVAGVQVTNVSGQPGDAPTVRIRGAGSTGSSEPLYIVDGFPVGGIDFLNPGDIQSIEVLKDAASSAIYGARGANGVVLITTKSGTRDGQMRITYDGYLGVQNPWKRLSLLNASEYALLMNEGAANAGLSLPYANPQSFGQGTDWQKEVFTNNAAISNHQLSIAGGTEKSSYITSFSHFGQEGIVGGDKSRFERTTFRLNADNQVKDYLKVGTNVAYTHIKRRAIDPNQEFGGILSNTINIDPITPVFETDPAVLAGYNPNAVRDASGRVYAISPRIGQEIVNPLARLEVLHGRTKVDKFVGNAYAELQPIKGLTLRSTYGIDMAFVSNDNFNPVYFLNGAQANSRSLVSKGTDRYFTWQSENTAQYRTSFGDHNFDFLVGTTAIKFQFENVFGSKQGLVSSDPNFAYLNLAVDAESAQAFGGANEGALLSYFSRINYNYKGKYLASATLRYDGSSRFGRENRFATFPSFSAGWVLSEESFLSGNETISFLKLRASWGQNGNENIGDRYPWAATIGDGRGYSFLVNGEPSFINGAVPSRIANPFLRWETSEQTDIGLELALFNDKLFFSADYYVKKTKGLLVVAPIPAIVGNNPPSVNGGTVENRGIELALNYQGNFNDVKYTIGFNAARNINEVTDIANAEQRLIGGGFATYGTVSLAEVGYPIGYFWGLQTNGIFQTSEEVQSYQTAGGQVIQPNAVAGDVRFVDRNGDGVINDLDRTIIGNPTPKLTLGTNLTASYKSFDFSAFFIGAFGHQIFNGTRRHDLVTSNMQSRYLDRWTGEGSTNEMPRFTWSDTNGNYSRISDLYIEDGDFVRLKTLQIGYNFNSQIVSKLKLQQMRVYVSGDNLLTFTNYSGFDPEIGARSALDIGVDRGAYPQARIYRLGFNVTF
jgi:TonB-dependent starch-binding outer membrane protein SusC